MSLCGYVYCKYVYIYIYILHIHIYIMFSFVYVYISALLDICACCRTLQGPRPASRQAWGNAALKLPRAKSSRREGKARAPSDRSCPKLLKIMIPITVTITTTIKNMTTE